MLGGESAWYIAKFIPNNMEFLMIGNGGVCEQGSYKAHWYLQLLYHKDRVSPQDCQDSTSCKSGRVSSLPPATETERIL